ncbi:acyl carrier protein [Pseudomonas sp. SO81]|uniref:acyl carrier protein n=1 Tax=Pseudomonas sp. SO81 TaxID=2983246 RepID=UPI0025A34F0E|nr:acyl carrier protein [Pseudomonas sp. SO81]WJN60656.1 Acyl carrier protein [Pseudomonas sp. SO81]
MDKQLQEAIAQRRAVLDKLKDSLIDRLNLYQRQDQIDDDTPLFGSGLKLDSVDATELVVMLEEEFGVRVSEGDDPSYMRNVNSLASFILQRQAAAA